MRECDTPVTRAFVARRRTRCKSMRPTAERIFDLDAEALQQFERRDTDIRMKGVNVTRDKKSSAARLSPYGVLIARVVDVVAEPLV